MLLAVLVVLAAGIGGTSEFTGARWFPNLGGVSTTRPPKHRTQLHIFPTLHRHLPKVHTGNAADWVGILILVLLALGVAALIWRWLRGRRLPPAPNLQVGRVRPVTTVVAQEPEPEPERLLTGVEFALQALAETRDPADAVVRAWLGLEETAEESGVARRPAETPTEFTTRIMSAAFTDDQALRTLLRLYLRTRFGDHPVTAGDVAEVRGALQQLVSNWHAGTTGKTA